VQSAQEKVVGQFGVFVTTVHESLGQVPRCCALAGDPSSGLSFFEYDRSVTEEISTDTGNTPMRDDRNFEANLIRLSRQRKIFQASHKKYFQRLCMCASTQRGL